MKNTPLAGIPLPVQEWLLQQGWGEVTGIQPVGGGCINHGARLLTEQGISFFLKTNSSSPPDMFERESDGLRVLRVDDGPRVPVSYLHGEDYLLLEDLQPSAPQGDYWETFGRQLGSLHLHTSPQFGFAQDNYIGSTPQPNGWLDDGWEFYSQHRLLYQAQLAAERGLLQGSDARGVERIAARLPDLVPPQPASLLHGDLWSGNAITDHSGMPAVIDPAVYFGWAEAELAMTSLFGAFPETFYRAYQGIRPLEPGFKGRFGIYNLYHLLNHLNLFGLGYLGEVKAVVRKFA